MWEGGKEDYEGNGAWEGGTVVAVVVRSKLGWQNMEKDGKEEEKRDA